MPFSHLAGLQYLELYGCKRIGDVTPLASLLSLRVLNLCYCGDKFLFAPIEILLSSLLHLGLYGSRPIDLQPELCGKNADENVVARVRAHYLDSRSGLGI